MVSDISVSEIVENVVRYRFSEVKISRVSVSPGIDRDGDPLLRVTVVFKTPAQSLEAAKVAELVRHIRSALAEKNIDDFPLLSFVSEKEAKKLKLAAA